MSKKVLSCLLAAVMVVLAIPMMAFAATAEEPIFLTETWDGGASVEFSEGARNNAYTILNFYQWYSEDDEPLPFNTEKDVPVDVNGYAKINPELISRGLVDADATYEEQLEQYKEYLLSANKLTYTGGWSTGIYQNGVYEKLDSRALIFQGQHLYNVRVNNSEKKLVLQRIPLNGTYIGTASATTPYIENYINYAKDFVQPGEDGILYYSEIAEFFATKALSDSFSTDHSETWDWKVGKGVIQMVADSLLPNGDRAFNVRPGDPGASASGVAYGYTVPEGIYGTAKLKIESIECFSSTGDPNKIEEGPSKFAIAVNGVGVWPEGVDITKASTFTQISADSKNTLNAGLADLEFDVCAGDVVSLVIVRDKVVCMDMRPTITIEQKYAVKFLDQDGNTMITEVVEPGADMPALPYACADGFYLNGGDQAISAEELPTTVTANVEIQYAGPVTVQDITLHKTAVRYTDAGLAIDVYLACDPYAIRGGANVNGLDTYGEKQEDGTYKLTISGIAARDMDEDIWIFPYHDFADGDSFSTPIEGLTINPITEIEQAKANAADDATANLMTALLDYAAAVDAYFDGGALDAETEARLAEQDADILALAKDVAIEAEYYDFAISAATLVIKDTVAIKVRVGLTEFDTLNDEVLDFTVKVTDESGREAVREGFTYQAGAAYNGVPIFAVLTLNGIAAGDFDTAWDIAVYDGYEQASATVSYSVNAYIARTFEGGAGETDNLLRALYALGVAAEA